MKNNMIIVTYQWTANEGNGAKLKAIYQEVAQQMKETEPGALKVDCFFNEEKGELLVIDYFQDAGALGQHLGTTAAKHFPELLKIAVPGAFLFTGDVPLEIQKGALGMGLQATFAPHAFGFDRDQ